MTKEARRQRNKKLLLIQDVANAKTEEKKHDLEFFQCRLQKFILILTLRAFSKICHFVICSSHYRSKYST
jgi:hypothetical protein